MKNLKISLILFPVFILMLQTSCVSQRIKGDGNVISMGKTVSSFNAIDVSSAFDIELTQGDMETVKIETDENIMPYVVVEVVNNELQIYIDTEVSIKKTTELKAVISFDDLKSIELSGATDLKGQNDFELNDLEIGCRGASKVDISLNGEDVNIDCSGASRLNLAGNAENVVLELSGASSISAIDLICKKYNAELSGASNAKIYVTESLDVDASGASSMKYKGEPANVDVDVSGASMVGPY